jgi:hypothetical protein
MAWGLVVAAAIGLAAYNATLFGDDLYLVEHFQIVLRARGVIETLKILVLNLDLGAREYRLYGASRVLHFGLSSMFGTVACGYAVFMAAAQSATALGTRRIVLALGGERPLANMLGIVWVLSPFATTTCFHYYSYAVLPYQLTTGCALVLLLGGHRWLSAVLGVLIALTGESHLAFAGAAFVLASLARGSQRRGALLDAAVPAAAMAATVLAHRLLWRWYHPDLGEQRFPLRLPDPSLAWTITKVFAVSLWRGLVVQVEPLITYSDAAIKLLAGILAGALALVAPRTARGTAGPRGREVTSGVVLLLGSLVVLLALALFTGQVAETLPRRYGYVPYTLLAMALVAALWSARRWVTTWPAAATCASTAWLWCCLELLLWPSIRAEDARVWAQIRSAMPAGRCVVFAAAWDAEATKHDYPYSMGMLSYRGPDAPEIIESTLSAFWWEAQYAIVATGAKFAAFKAIDLEDGTVKLFGNDHNGRPPRVVARGDVIVVSDDRSTPPHWWDPPRVSVGPLRPDTSARSR